ncbi:HAD-IIIA family hydrolase [Parvibaculum sp.]|uniref:D-glycero-alpha-D-manno-heptose-1,7-bisphosphate 7-phosphatase n=1 Tax=Parvibaculum sp. TaxID=2024848 RepID=UPI001B07D13E|nr:HAD-IIIA family hydrolase [Parvibaculum sp.]MBO6634666.1 HAD-IIIA family hydrolase [Parvibaculum sp.]MBO6679248.1 HAD-IIIA family hydrolase [Parvibaculum sp.]MBO6685556.1 HAD-IIIA family hydrolase [Parvibaculum sp.]MBO6904621.1 HAD-IIIA family hydrolase [Parvibaculum sp.]
MTTPPDIWLSTPTPPRRQGAPGLFLDRDGVLVKEVNYLKNKEDVALETGAAEIVAWGRAKGFGLVCVTNQSGIARGLISWAEFEAVEMEIARQLREQEGTLDLTLACPFHPDFTDGYGPEQDRWRKPGPAMIEHGAALMGLDLAKSWLVGDKAADIEAAKRAGLKGAVIVATGYGAEEREAAMAQESKGFTVLSAATLDEARALLEMAF